MFKFQNLNIIVRVFMMLNKGTRDIIFFFCSKLGSIYSYINILIYINHTLNNYFVKSRKIAEIAITKIKILIKFIRNSCLYNNNRE